MKPNYEKEIRKQTEEIMAIAAESLSKGDYLKIVNRCGKIVLAHHKQIRSFQRSAAYVERVNEPITNEEVARAEDKKTFDRQRILDILQQGRTLSTVEAIQMGILRAGARIFELRKEGYQIETNLKKTASGSRIAEYRLIA